MNSGALDAIERAPEGDLARAVAGFRWLRLEPVADLLASVRTDGAAEDQRPGAVLAALVSGLVLRSLCYTVTALRSAVTAAV